jgi:hypothetical protein
MARKKSAFRRWFSIRRLRWLAMRGVALICQPIAVFFNFPSKSVSAIECSAVIFENAEVPVILEHSPGEAEGLLSKAAYNDTGGSADTTGGRAVMRHQACIVKDCTLLGHTLTVIHQRAFRLVSYDRMPGNWNFAKPAILRRKLAPPGRLHLLSGTNNYFHFFANGVLPVLRFLQQNPDEKLTLVSPEHAPLYVNETISALLHYFPSLRQLILRSDEKLVDAEAVWLFGLCSNFEWMPIDRDSASLLRSVLNEYWGSAYRPPGIIASRLLLDRGDSKLRRMTDRKSIHGYLRNRGFEEFIAHPNNFQEQIARFSAAKEVVAVHGAGLTNLLFCDSGTQVTEIFPSNFVKSTYFWLSKRLGLEYRFVVGGAGDYDQAFEVGIDRVRAQFEQ